MIASSAPQIRYPDYGIDMARMGDFIAFRAAIALLKEQGKTDIIDAVYQKCKTQETLPNERGSELRQKEIYEPFTAEEISAKIAELLTPPDVKARVSIVYQDIEDLHLSCPNNPGDWYFTGNYPTAGGNRW